jgi:hypothetical protein
MVLWALLWFVLLLSTGLVLGLLGRMLWRKAKALTREIGEASERLTGVLASLNDLTDAAGDRPAPSPATRGGRRPIGVRADNEARHDVRSS